MNKCKFDWELEKDNLYKRLVENNESYVKVGLFYNVSGTAIKKIAQKLGIELKSRRKINPNETFNKGNARIGYCKHCGKEYYTLRKESKFCSIKCASEYKHEELYKRVLNGDKSVMRANFEIKCYKKDIIKEQNGICAICGCEQVHNGKPLVFILDHIDGNAANNKRDNLRCICPNCDSQLDTYKSKNKNGARHYYRYHKEKIIK